MIWAIVIELIIILFMGWMIWDSQKAIKTLIEMWAEEKNRQWLECLEESGTEIIRIDHDVKI